MSIRYSVCAILGDGQPPDGYYAAIRGVVDPVSGFQAYPTIQEIGFNPDGSLLFPWALAASSGETWALVSGNADITLLPDYPLDAAVSAMHLPTRNALGAALQARGIDVSVLGIADGYRDVINYLGRLHNPAFSVDNFSPL